MKLNWGTGITIAIILFMAFIVTLVVIVSNASVELVSENYYDLEMKYEDRIVAKSNAVKFQDSIEINQFNGNIFVQFPTHFNSEDIEGQVHLYRSSNVSMDVIVPMSDLKDGQIIIPESDITPGKYSLQISWKDATKNYYLDKLIIVK